MENFYGYKKEEFLKLKYSDISASSENLDLYSGNPNDLSTGVSPTFIHLKKDGTVFPVEISTCGFMWGGRRTLCAIARDITHRSKAKEKESQI